jgi:hypothetical protein
MIALLSLFLGLASAAPATPAAATLAATAEAPPRPRTAVTASLVLQVSQPVAAADALVAEARALGGWFQVRTQDRVELRVPVEKIDALIAKATASGKVADRGLQRVDLTRDVENARARLAAREQVLGRYYEVLEQAGPKNIFAVERQIVDAIQRIETIQGQLRVLEDRADYARLDVAFRFRDRAAPKPDGTSSFAWLNTLDVQRVRGALATDAPGWTTAGLGVPAPPDGFSAFRKHRRYRAASPDGVLFVARTVKHEPEAGVAFWQEAVRERARAAGYRVVADETITVGGVDGVRLELQAPLGEEDWTYLLAFFPNGRRVAIVEAAGQVARFDARRSAILAAIDGLQP